VWYDIPVGWAKVAGGARRGLALLAVLGALWGLWEGLRTLWVATGWTWPFFVDDTTMPHIHAVLGQLATSPQVGGPALGTILFHSALFTAKEAALGFAMGALVGFSLGVVLVHSRLLQRGLMPYVVASQTVPLIVISPMIVVGLGNLAWFGWLGWAGLTDGSSHMAAWVRVAVIAAYLTFFPVTISSLRGLQSADPRALDLMNSYAASRWSVLWKLRVPASMPYLFSALKISATASVVGAIIGELPSGIQSGLGGAILNFNQYYSSEPKSLWATNVVAACVGIFFFLAVILAERVVVRRAPEHIA
jgi:NitT/TauT family transport system permease protein